KFLGATSPPKQRRQFDRLTGRVRAHCPPVGLLPRQRLRLAPGDQPGARMRGLTRIGLSTAQYFDSFSVSVTDTVPAVCGGGPDLMSGALNPAPCVALELD